MRSGLGVAALLLGRLLAEQRVADEQAAEVAERLGRDLQGLGFDDREPGVVVAAVEGERGEGVGGHPRRADAVPREAEAVVDAGRRGCRRSACGWVRRRSARPMRGRSAARRGRGRTGRGAGATATATPASTSAWRCTPGSRDASPAAPAERDPAVRRGPEVVEQVAGVGDALAAGPADLLDQVGDGLGDDHVARGQRQPVAERPQGLLGSACGEHSLPGAHAAAGSRTSTPSAPHVDAGDPRCSRRPRPGSRSASPVGPSARRAGFTVAEPGKNAPDRKIGDAQRACTSASLSAADRAGVAELLGMPRPSAARCRRTRGRSRPGGSRRGGTRHRPPAPRTIRRPRRRPPAPRAQRRSLRGRRTERAWRAG